MNLFQVAFFVLAPSAVLALVLANFRDDLRRDAPAVAFLAAASLILFYRIVFLGEALSQSDANLIQLRFFQAYKTAVLGSREIPFWNPLEGAGLPTLAHPLSAMFYPLTPLFLFGNIFKALSIFVVCHYFLAAVFALLLGTRLFRHRQAALAFAVLYAFNGWALARVVNTPALEYLFAYTWLPLAALGFEKGLEGRRVLSSVAAVGAAFAWMGISCPNLFIYATLLLTVAFAVRLAALARERKWDAVKIGSLVVLGGLIFAFALGAIEYIPARELSEYSTSGRFGVRFPGEWRGRPLSVWEIVRLYFPFRRWAAPFAAYYSPGILALVAALYGLWAITKRRANRWLAAGTTAIFAVGVLLATKTWFYYFLGGACDIFSRSSLIPSALIFLVVPVVLVSAAGVDAVISKWKPIGLAGWLMPVLIFAELSMWSGMIYTRRAYVHTYNYKKELADFPHLDYILKAGAAGRLLVIEPAENYVLAPSYAMLERGLARLDLYPAAFAPNWLNDVVQLEKSHPNVAELEALGVGWLVSAAPLPKLGQPIEIPWPEVSKHFERSIYFQMHYRPEWRAWDKVVRLYRLNNPPAHVWAKELRVDTTSLPTIAREESEDPPVDFLNSNLEYFRSWVSITKFTQTPNRLVAVVPTVAPCRLFFAVTTYPGWRVCEECQEVSCVKAAGAFMETEVPKGQRNIELRFEPKNWRFTLALAIAAVMFQAVVTGVEVRKNRRDQAVGLTTGTALAPRSVVLVRAASPRLRQLL